MRRVILLLAVAVVLCVGSGCQWIVNFIAVAMPDPEVPARYDLEDRRIVLLCTPTERIEAGYSNELTYLVSELNRQLSEKVDGIQIVPPDRVADYRTSHPAFDSLSRLEIGRHFKADRLVELELEQLTMHRGGEWLLQGVAIGTVRVANIQNGGKVEFDERIEFTHPKRQPYMADDTTARKFVRIYVQKLSARVAMLFYEHPRKAEREW